jgi:hypothetical protein
MNKQEAEILATETKCTLIKGIGGDWKIKVWNNLGWHCDVELGTICCHIDPLPKLTYSAYISNDTKSCGSALAIWSEDNNYSQKSPVTAVKNAIRNVKTYIAGLQGIVQYNDELIASTVSVKGKKK